MSIMDFLSGIASKLGELLVDATIKQARYLFCFNSIVKELEDEENDLKGAQDGINSRIEEERRKRPDIVVKKDVEQWLQRVKNELTDVQNLKAKIDEKETCLHGLCPNWCCRYWLGRKAAEKISILPKLKKNFSRVAQPESPPLNRVLSIPSCFSSSFGTTELACNKIIGALKEESTKMVGLYGLGGVGKTTLAKFVGNQLQQQNIFDKVGRATVSRDPNIIQVQNELRKSLGWELDGEDENDRADRLRLMFSASKSSKILIIIDDVWNPFDLEKKLGIPVGDRDNCCKILLTTRKKTVCDSLGCHPHIPLCTLTPDEGLTLLKANAGIDVNDSTLDDVSKQVADQCKGLPLAIEAVGSALREKGFGEWNLALSKLKAAKMYEIEDIDTVDQDVYRCLEFSYDALKGKDSKSCFLLCSLFPEDYEIDLEELVGYALVLDLYDYEDGPSITEARSLVSATVKGLKDASLLLDVDDDNYVKMHDIVRDVAIWISTKKEGEKMRFFSKNGIGLAKRAVESGLDLKQYRGMSLVGNKKEELPSGLVCPNLQILRLENTVYDYKLQVSKHFFEEMKALKVVTIIGGVLSLKSLQPLTNLQVLWLIRCDVSDASFLGRLKRLEILYLISSLIEIPEELGGERGLNELNCLSIEDCEDLECIVDASQLPHGKNRNHEMLSRLAELRLDHLPELKWIWKAPTQHVRLQTLTELSVSNCNNLTYIFTLSQAQSLDQLKSLEVSECERLEYIVKAKFDHIEGEISEGDGNTMLELLLLRKLELQNLPKLISFCSENYYSIWPALEELCLEELSELKWIWKAPAQHLSLQTLAKLTVYKCYNLTYIFTLSQAQSLDQLKSLYVSECERLEYIVEAKFDHIEGEISEGYGNTMFKLPSLRKLNLGFLPKLISFCSENYYSIWPALEKLYLVDCPNLIVNRTELEANLQYLREKLQILSVENCSHLRDTIPALLKHGLKNLEKLSIDKLGVQVVFQLEAIFPCLKELNLVHLEELQVLLYHEGPTHIFSLQNLTILNVRGCTKLRHLLSSTLARNLLQLEELWITNCLELEQIIDEDEGEDHLQPVCFPKLKWIYIHQCSKLKRLFHISVARSLQKLHSLHIYNNDKLEEVFWHKDGADVMDYNEIVMNELRQLTLLQLPNLTNFWPAGYQIPFPSFVTILNCPKFRANSEG